jgi:hypothetical protein
LNPHSLRNQNLKLIPTEELVSHGQFVDTLTMDKPKNGGLRGSGRRKAVIANLPSGVGVTKMNNGSGREYWRVRLGKRFTGGAIVKKYFDDVAGARAYIDGHKDQRADTGADTYVLSGDQLAEAKNAFERLAGTGLLPLWRDTADPRMR